MVPRDIFQFSSSKKGPDEYSKLNSLITTLTLVELPCYFFSSRYFFLWSRVETILLRFRCWRSTYPPVFYLVSETPKLRFGAFGELGELGPQISVFQLFKKWLSLLNVLLGSKKFTFLRKSEKSKKLLCFWRLFKGVFRNFTFWENTVYG